MAQQTPKGKQRILKADGTLVDEFGNVLGGADSPAQEQPTQTQQPTPLIPGQITDSFDPSRFDYNQPARPGWQKEVANQALTAAQLGSSFLGLGIPVSMGINAALSMGQGYMNSPATGIAAGKDAASAGLWSLGLDALPYAADKFARGATKLAFGTGQMKLDADQLDDVTDAYMRTRHRIRGANPERLKAGKGWRNVPPVGDNKGLKAFREDELIPEAHNIVSKSNRAETPFRSTFTAGTPGSKTMKPGLTPDDFVGLDTPLTTAKDLARRDAQFIDETEALFDAKGIPRQQPPKHAGPVANGAVPGSPKPIGPGAPQGKLPSSGGTGGGPRVPTGRGGEVEPITFDLYTEDAPAGGLARWRGDRLQPRGPGSVGPPQGPSGPLGPSGPPGAGGGSAFAGSGQGDHLLNAEMLHEIAAKQGKSANQLFKKLSGGDWVPADESAQWAAAARQKTARQAVKDALTAHGNAADVPRYEDILSGMSDTYKVENVNDFLWHGIRAATLRGGGAAAIGGGLAALTGVADPRTISAISGLLGGAASPKNISRFGNVAGTAMENGPTIARAARMASESHMGNVEDQKKRSRTKRREPK